MKLSIDGQEITIDYIHATGNGQPTSTICTVTIGKRVFRGTAIFSAEQNFSRYSARRTALTQAVQKAMTRDQRKVFWPLFWHVRNEITQKEVKVVTGKYVA